MNEMSLINSFNFIKLIISLVSPFQCNVLHVCSPIISCLSIFKFNIYIFLLLVRLKIFLCKNDQLTINDPIFSNHSIAVDFKPIQPENDF